MSTKIEWTEETWNPVLGCDKISEGCKNCYAIKTAWIRQHNSKMAERFSGLVEKTEAGKLNWTGKINLLGMDVLTKPLRKKKPTMYFVNSMSDLFHEDVPFSFIDRVFAIMKACPQHTFQILTKRPQRMAEYFTGNTPQAIDDATIQLMEDGVGIGTSVCLVQMNGVEGWPLPNVWMGVSVENQKAADERIQYLNFIPAAVKFLSIEPLLGPVDLLKEYPVGKGTVAFGALVDWVIVGGESGHHASPMHPDWVRSIRRDCRLADIPFFFKQWGEWREVTESDLYDTSKGRTAKNPAFIVSYDGSVHCYKNEFTSESGVIMIKVGKSYTGRLLDGQLHDEFPVVK